MKKKHAHNSAITMIELLFALLVSALAIGPIFFVLSSTTSMSIVAIYEQMAVHYATELCDQIRELAHQVESFSELRDTLEFLSLDENVLRDNFTQQSLGAGVIAKKLDIKLVAGKQISMLLSALHPVITQRFIEVTRETSPEFGDLLRIVVTVEWDDSYTTSIDRKVVMVLFVK